MVTVIVVADYAAGDDATYASLRAALAGLARQTYSGRVEHIVLESARLRQQLPADLATVLTDVQLVFCAAQDSLALRNEGVRLARGDVVVFLDADCIPDPQWLERMVATMADHPEVSVVSGRTVYGGASVMERTLSLLSRAYVDRGDAGTTRYISNNNAGFRRAVLLAHPFPTCANPFVTALHAGAILAAGGILWFDPQAPVVHAYGGWTFEMDVSRNAGWATIAVRQAASQARLAWLVRLGYAAIPAFVLAAVLKSWWRLLRFGPAYGLAWYELPVGFAAATVSCAMQAPGMWDALSGKPVFGTRYR